jgi:hypothetical protein
MVFSAVSETKKTTELDSKVLQEILNALQGLRYGSVEITIQEGKVIQVERKEKKRIKPQ